MSNRNEGFVFYFDNILAGGEPAAGPARVAAVRPVLLRGPGVAGHLRGHRGGPGPVPPAVPAGLSGLPISGGRGVLRDTQKWLAQQELRTRRREQQGRAPLAARPASPVQDSPQSLERYRQDVELARRVLEESRREDEAWRRRAPEKSWARRQARPCLTLEW